MQTESGIFTPRYPKKCGNSADRVRYRSSWEREFMEWLDTSHRVRKWQFEPFIFNYVSPLDGKTHDYIPDFYIQYEFRNRIFREVIEIKPADQVSDPVNAAKWLAAEQACLDYNKKNVKTRRFRVLVRR